MMTLQHLSDINEKFQLKASEIAELLPGSNLLSFSSSIIRSSRKMDATLQKIMAAKSVMTFYTQMDALEDEMDELIYLLDKLDVANKVSKITTLTDFVKRGYEMLSLYSICCDQILEKKAKKQDEIE